MVHKAIIVFTGRSPTQIVNEGGSQAWALDPQRARECEYLVCTQNRKAGDWAHPTEPHGEAFLVGKVSGVVHSKERQEPNRYLIQISEYARTKIPNVWKGHRNPVRYATLEDLEIDPAKLSFERMQQDSLSSTEQQTATDDLQMDKHMEGVTGWFSHKEPKTDRCPASLALNDDGTITIAVQHPDGLWTIGLQLDQRWALLSGQASCGELRATVTWAFLKEYASRKWRLTGEWIESGESYHWWADLIETEPCREKLDALVARPQHNAVAGLPENSDRQRRGIKTELDATPINRPGGRLIDFSEE